MINIIVPLLVVIIIIYGIYKKVDIFDTFLLGVKEGLKVSINLFPTIFAMVIAITMLTITISPSKTNIRIKFISNSKRYSSKIWTR